MYMENRIPLPPDSPATAFPIQKYSGLSEQVDYAAKVILGALDFKEKLDRYWTIDFVFHEMNSL